MTYALSGSAPGAIYSVNQIRERRMVPPMPEEDPRYDRIVMRCVDQKLYMSDIAKQYAAMRLLDWIARGYGHRQYTILPP